MALLTEPLANTLGESKDPDNAAGVCNSITNHEALSRHPKYD
jgi:hypothetical protein